MRSLALILAAIVRTRLSAVGLRRRLRAVRAVGRSGRAAGPSTLLLPAATACPTARRARSTGLQHSAVDGRYALHARLRHGDLYGFADYSIGRTLGVGQELGLGNMQATLGVRMAEPWPRHRLPRRPFDPRRYLSGRRPAVAWDWRGNSAAAASSWVVEWKVGASVLYTDRGFDTGAGVVNPAIPSFTNTGSMLNVDGLLGLSYWFDSASKLTLGYRADYFKGGSPTFNVSATAADSTPLASITGRWSALQRCRSKRERGALLRAPACFAPIAAPAPEPSSWIAADRLRARRSKPPQQSEAPLPDRRTSRSAVADPVWRGVDRIGSQPESLQPRSRASQACRLTGSA